ncbi:MAG: HDOD domain-containing protein [Verrucomicrobium sp.]|nr:HDOD domain-containing protein [Verrucomicrobium sp.]
MSSILPISMVCELARTLPCAPALLPKLIALLSDPEKANAKEMESLIMRDPGLATSVLRFANSAFFSRTFPCETVGDAVMRIGFRQVYRIAASSIAGRWLINQPQGYGWEPGDLYKHSLCVGVSVEHLAKKTKQVPEELAYTSGLLHDVGKLALAHACADHFESIRSYQEIKQVSWRQAEHTILGYDHTEIGGVLMEEWGYPASLVQVARFYPRPSLATPDQRLLVGHVHAAKHLATLLGYGVGEDGFHTELDEAVLKECGITEELLEELLPSVVKDAEKLIAAGMGTE